MEKYALEGERTGAAWMEAIMYQSNNTAFWMYPHDSGCHFYEDAMENSIQESNDDTILETGNGKVRQIGKRKVFHGGRNNRQAVDKVRLKPVVKKGALTGEVSEKRVQQRLPVGQAGQVQRWHMLQQITQAQHKSRSDEVSMRKAEVKQAVAADHKVKRAEVREHVKNEVQKLYDKVTIDVDE